MILPYYVPLAGIFLNWTCLEPAAGTDQQIQPSGSAIIYVHVAQQEVRAPTVG